MRELIRVNKQLFLLKQIEVNYEYCNEKDSKEVRFHYLTKMPTKSKNSLERLIEKVLAKAIINKDFEFRLSKSIDAYELRKNKEYKLDLEMSESYEFIRLITPSEKRIKNAFYFSIEDSIESLIEFFRLRPGIPLTRFEFVIRQSVYEKLEYKALHKSIFKLEYKAVGFRQPLLDFPDLDNSVPTT